MNPSPKRMTAAAIAALAFVLTFAVVVIVLPSMHFDGPIVLWAAFGFALLAGIGLYLTVATPKRPA